MDREEKIACFHCGDECKEDHISFENKDFCCNGCKTVYEILQENDLCTYYDFEKNPGLSLKSKDFKNKYAYLDNNEIAQILFDFFDEERAIVNFYIPAIHCSSCIWLLENLYKIKEGIDSSRVNFSKKELRIDFTPGIITIREMVELLTTIGYEPLISLEDHEKKRTKGINRSLITKIGVSGFAFGNIMLLSFPEYFGFEGLEDAFLRRFINYLNIVLALPVVFYCGSDYFKSAWGGLKQRFINIDIPISIGILALFSRSLYEILLVQGPGYLDSLSGLIFFLLVGKWFQGFTYEGLSFDRDYKSYFPIAITRILNDNMQSVPIRELKAGDEILVRNMEIIPADSELISAHAKIDYSFVTGESIPVSKKNKDLIYAGGRQVGEGIRLKIMKNVSHSYLMQLWNNDIFQKEEDNEFNHLVNVISKYFTIVVLLLSVIAFLLWFSKDFSKAINSFTAVLIVACPCALALATPFTLGTTMRIFGLQKFYLKSAYVIEKLLKVDHIIFDKTGTLTENTNDEIQYEGKALGERQLQMVKTLVANSTHPLSRRLDNAIELPQNKYEVRGFEELVGEGLKGRFGNQEMKLGSISFVTENTAVGDIPKDTSSKVFVSTNGELHGFFRIKNNYREDVEDIIEALQNKYRLSVLTGDNEAEKNNLLSIFPSNTKLKFDQSPQDKLEYVKQLQSAGENVLMIGDGLNDAGALKQSEIGFTLTDDITNFSPASDGILKADQLKILPRILDFARISRLIIITAFGISFLYNLVGIGFAISGLLTPLIAAILMPLSSISVVAFCVFVTKGLATIKDIH